MEMNQQQQKNHQKKNLDSVNKRSSSQKTLNLSPTQRLDHLIQANDSVSEGIDNESKKNPTSLPRPPPIPPRQTKSDDKPTTSTAPLIVKQSNPITSSSNDNNNNNHPTKELSNDNNDQPLLIQMSPQKNIQWIYYFSTYRQSEQSI